MYLWVCFISFPKETKYNLQLAVQNRLCKHMIAHVLRS